MRTWWRQLAPYLVLLSVVGNLYLGAQTYNRDKEINLVTWGNSVDDVWKYFHWLSMDLMPQPDGRVSTTAPQGLTLARESLDSLRSLPYFNRRVENDDLRTLEQFLRYASESYAVAVKEQGEKGTVSAESVQRLTKLKEGLVLVVRHQQTTNQLKSSSNPWNHAQWRSMWHNLATGLQAIDFVPLPQ